MTCPDCGHDNIDGLDTCEHCGQDLRSIDIPRAKSGLQRTIMKTPIRELEPLPALTVAPGESVAAAIRLMQKERHGSVMVIDGEQLVGMFTEHDLLTRIAGRSIDLDATPIDDVMLRNPKALSETDTLAQAMHRMAVGNYRHIPVVEEGKPVRFVSVRGVLRYLHEHTR
jgi:CBS domain-containing protein